VAVDEHTLHVVAQWNLQTTMSAGQVDSAPAAGMPAPASVAGLSYDPDRGQFVVLYGNTSTDAPGVAVGVYSVHDMLPKTQNGHGALTSIKDAAYPYGVPSCSITGTN